MTDPRTLGPWLRRFLEEHIVSERNLARNTQLSYRDTLVLLLRFVSRQTRKAADQLTVRDLSAERVRAFLLHLEQERGCLPQTRNQRLAALHAFARYVGSCSPEHVEWCGQIRAIPLKKVVPAAIGYLEKLEIDALLAAPNRATPLGRRDHALLLFLYSTGARVSEAARLTVGDLHPAAAGHPLVTLRGKGGKTRRCPLLPGTAAALAGLVARCAERVPALAARRVCPHVLRHTAATHLLRSGVDLNTVRAWLGHVRIDTTLVYAELDLETKAKAIAQCDDFDTAPTKPWREDKGLMAYLQAL